MLGLSSSQFDPELTLAPAAGAMRSVRFGQRLVYLQRANVADQRYRLVLIGSSLASLWKPCQSQSLQHSLHLAIECGRSDRWLDGFQRACWPQLDVVGQCVVCLLLPAN